MAAAGGMPDAAIATAVLVGGALAAGGAHALNHYFDRDIDAVMSRTSGRPVAAGRVTPQRAFVFGVLLNAAAFVMLSSMTNTLSAVLTPERDAVLCARLHDGSEEDYAAQHRHWRRGRGHPADGGMGGCHGRSRDRGAVHVLHRVLLDPASLLGACAAHQGRLRPSRDPDAARRRGRGRDEAADIPVHPDAGRAEHTLLRNRNGGLACTWARPSHWAYHSSTTRGGCYGVRSPKAPGACFTTPWPTWRFFLQPSRQTGYCRREDDRFQTLDWP